MATSPVLYSGKQSLLQFYNRKKNKTLTLDDVEFGIPERIDTPGTTSNSVVRMFPKLGSALSGSPKLYYDRIHLSTIGTIVVERGIASRLHELLDAINEKYNTSFTTEDVEDQLLDTIQTGEIWISLKILPGSIMYYDGEIIYTPRNPDPATQSTVVVDQYATWSIDDSSSSAVITNGELTSAMNRENMVITTLPIQTGKSYWEVRVEEGGLIIGVARANSPVVVTGKAAIGTDALSWGLNTSTGQFVHNNTSASYCPPVAVGAYVGVLLDVQSGTLVFQINNVMYNIATIGLEQYDDLHPVVCGAAVTVSKGTANFGAISMHNAAPTDYTHGVFKVKPAVPSLPGGGGGVQVPAAGTLFTTYCRGLNRWGIFADGNGGVTDVEVQPNSVACGFTPDVRAALSLTPAEVEIAKGTIAETAFSLSNGLEEDVVFNVTVTYAGNAGSTYHNPLQVRIGGGPVAPIANGKITIPAGDDTFLVRTLLTSGFVAATADRIIITLQVAPEVAGLITNTTPTVFTVKLIDQSNLPAGTLISFSCAGFDKVGVFADGNGGTYNDLIEADSEECGFVPMVARTVKLQGSGSVTLPAGTSSVKVTGRGGAGKGPEIIAGPGIPTSGWKAVPGYENKYLELMGGGAAGENLVVVAMVDNNTNVYTLVSVNSTGTTKAHSLQAFEAIRPSSLVYGNGVFVVDTMFGADRFTRYSIDGENWPEVAWKDGIKLPPANSGEEQDHKIKFVGGKFITLRASAQRQFGVSDDGINWRVIDSTNTTGMGSTGQYRDVHFLDGKWIFVWENFAMWSDDLSVFHPSDMLVTASAAATHQVHSSLYANNKLVWSFATNDEAQNPHFFYVTADMETFDRVNVAIGVDTVDYIQPLTSGGNGYWLSQKYTPNSGARRSYYSQNLVDWFKCASDEEYAFNPADTYHSAQFVNGYFYAANYVATDDNVSTEATFYRIARTPDAWKQIDISATPAFARRKVFGTFLLKFYSTSTFAVHGLAYAAATKAIQQNPESAAGERAVVTIGGSSAVFPGSATEVVPTPVERTLSANQNAAVVVAYTAPYDTSIQLDFIGRRQSFPAMGTDLGESCQQFDRVKTFTNGNGGSYYQVLTLSSPACGYNADTLKDLTLTGANNMTIPAGTTSITVRGRGSAFAPAVLGTAAQNIPLVYEEIASNDMRFRFIKSMTTALGMYVGASTATMGQGTYRGIFRSLDLKNFEHDVTLPSDFNSGTSGANFVPSTIVYSNGYFVAIQDSSTPILQSPDGVNWEYLTNTESLPITRWMRVFPSNAAGYSYLVRDSSMFGSSDSLGSVRVGLIDHQSKTIARLPTISSASGITADSLLINGEFIYVFTTQYRSDLSQLKSAVYRTSNPQLEGSWQRFEVSESPIDEFDYGLLRITACVNIGNMIIAAAITNLGFCTIYKSTDNAQTWTKTTSQPLTGVIKLLVVGSYFILTGSESYYSSTDGVTWVVNQYEVLDAGKKRTVIDSSSDKFFINAVNDTIFQSKALAQGDQYAVQRARLGAASRAGFNKVFYEFPGSTTETPPAEIEHVIPVNSPIPLNLAYEVPVGGAINLQYMGVSDSAPANGTFLGTACEGFNQMNIYANGAGGTYRELNERNSAACGYVAPVIQANLSTNKNSYEIKEGEIATNVYALSRSLDADVSFVLDIQSGTGITGGDATVEYSVGSSNTWLAATDGVEITVPQGVSFFQLRVISLADGESEANETITVSFVPTLNASKITSVAGTTTTFTIVDKVVLIIPSSFDSGNTDTARPNREGLFFNGRAISVSKHTSCISAQALSAGKYYVEVTLAESENFIIGISAPGAINLDSGSHVYPGKDALGWGFAPGQKVTNGVFTAYGASWAGKTVGLLADLDNRTVSLALDGVSQGIGFNLTTDPFDNFNFALANVDTATVLTTLVNFGQEAPRFSVAGYAPGWGTIVEEQNYVEPDYPAKNRLTPTKFDTTATSGLKTSFDKRAVLVTSGKAIRSVFAIESSDWVWEFTVPSHKTVYVGVATANHPLVDAGTPANTRLGSNNHSWAVKISIDSVVLLHNGVETQLSTQFNNRYDSSFAITRSGKKLTLTDGSYVHVMTDDLQANVYPAVSTDATAAQGGALVIGNFGQAPFSIFPQDGYWPGVGVITGNPPANMKLSEGCTGVDKTVTYADGNGGTYNSVTETNSYDCGYEIPSAYYESATLRGFSFNDGDEQTRINVTTGRKFGIGKLVIGSGKWYWEVSAGANSTAAIGIGVGGATHNARMGTSSDTIGISFEDKMIRMGGVVDNSLETAIDTRLYNKVFGMMYDNTTNTLSLVMPDDGEVIPLTQKITPHADLRVLIGSDSITGDVYDARVNLGQKAYELTVPPGYGSIVSQPPFESTYYQDNGTKKRVSFFSTDEVEIDFVEGYTSIISNTALTAGKWYWEVKMDATGAAAAGVGTINYGKRTQPGMTAEESVVSFYDGGLIRNGVGVEDTSLQADWWDKFYNKVARFLWDADARTLQVMAEDGTTYSMPVPTGNIYPLVGNASQSNKVTAVAVNLGQRAFVGSIPSGYVRVVELVPVTSKWTHATALPSGEGYYTHVGNNPNRLVAIASSLQKPWLSDDAGDTWLELDIVNMGPGKADQFVVSDDGSKIVVFTTVKDVLYNDTFGTIGGPAANSWVFSDQPVTDVYGLRMTISGGVVRAYYPREVSGDWKISSIDLPSMVVQDVGDGATLAPGNVMVSTIWASKDNAFFLVSKEDGKFFKSTTGLPNWVEITNPFGASPIKSIFASEDLAVIYAVGANGAQQSTDGGTTWAALGRNVQYTYLGACSADGSVVVLLTDNAKPYISKNYGISFTEMSEVEAAQSWSWVSISPNGKNISVAGFQASKPWFYNEDK